MQATLAPAAISRSAMTGACHRQATLRGVSPAVQRGGVRRSMQHELERLGTTPSQPMVVIGVGRPTCTPPTAQRCRSLRRRRDGLRSSLSNDQTGFSLLRFCGHTRFRRELEHGCLLAFI